MISDSVIFCVYVYLGMIIIGFLSFYTSSYKELARYYRTNELRPKNFLILQGIGISSRNSTNIGVSETGIYISWIMPFNLSHRPILIPWNAIKKVSFNNFDKYHIYIETPRSQEAEDILKSKIPNKNDSIEQKLNQIEPHL